MTDERRERIEEMLLRIDRNPAIAKTMPESELTEIQEYAAQIGIVIPKIKKLRGPYKKRAAKKQTGTP